MKNITIVTGGARSRTSMMMYLLSLGGYKTLPFPTSEEMRLINSHPHGNFEGRLFDLKDPKQPELGYYAKVQPELGYAYKMISLINLQKIADLFPVKVIYLERSPEARLSSFKDIQKRIEDLSGKKKEVQLTTNTLETTDTQRKSKLKGFDVLYIDSDDLVLNPEKYISILEDFLGEGFNGTEAIKGVDKTLYKQR